MGYIHRTNFKKKQPIPISMIVGANNVVGLCRFNTLRVWVKLKNLYRHHTAIYNLSYYKLQNQTGISHTSLRKHIKLMIQYGWANWNGNTLVLYGIERLKTHADETCVLVPIRETRNEQIQEFRKVIIHQNIVNQGKKIICKEQIVKKAKTEWGKLSKQQMKVIAKFGGLKQLSNSLIKQTTLSNRRIGQLLYRSPQTGKTTQKRLNNLNLIKSTPRYEIVKNNATVLEATMMNRDLGGGYSVNMGRLMKQLSNAIVVV